MLKLANVIVKGGDNWNTNYNIDRGFLRQVRKIFQDPLIGNARAIHVKRIGKAFYIVQKQVCEGKDPFKMHPRKVACRVYRRVDLVFLAFFKKLGQGIDLEHTFTARNGHSSVRRVVKCLVLGNLGYNVIYAFLVAVNLPCSRRARIRAGTAHVA